MTLKHHYKSKTVLMCEKKSIELFGFKISTGNRLWTSDPIGLYSMLYSTLLYNHAI